MQKELDKCDSKKKRSKASKVKKDTRKATSDKDYEAMLISYIEKELDTK